MQHSGGRFRVSGSCGILGAQGGRGKKEVGRDVREAVSWGSKMGGAVAAEIKREASPLRHPPGRPPARVIHGGPATIGF